MKRRRGSEQKNDEMMRDNDDVDGYKKRKGSKSNLLPFAKFR